MRCPSQANFLMLVLSVLQKSAISRSILPSLARLNTMTYTILHNRKSLLYSLSPSFQTRFSPSLVRFPRLAFSGRAAVLPGPSSL